MNLIVYKVVDGLNGNHEKFDLLSILHLKIKTVELSVN